MPHPWCKIMHTYQKECYTIHNTISSQKGIWKKEKYDPLYHYELILILMIWTIWQWLVPIARKRWQKMKYVRLRNLRMEPLISKSPYWLNSKRLRFMTSQKNIVRPLAWIEVYLKWHNEVTFFVWPYVITEEQNWLQKKKWIIFKKRLIFRLASDSQKYCRNTPFYSSST